MTISKSVTASNSSSTKNAAPKTSGTARPKEIIDIQFDDAASVTCNSKNNFMYTVQLDDGEIPEIYF